MTEQPKDTAISLPPRDAGTTAFRWLCSGVRAAILDGRLAAGARLPSTRALASRSGLARGTVVTAYEQLEAEGYVEARASSGSYVCASLPDRLLAVPAPRAAVPVRRRRPRLRLSTMATRTTAFAATAGQRARAFRTNEPALDLFPTTLWAQIAGRRLRRAGVDHLRVGDVAGYAPLRAVIADYLTTSRGVVCEPDQIVVVSGVQEALDLTARVLVDPGDRVYIEDPGYPGAVRSFTAVGARVVGVPIQSDGAALPTGRGHGAARLLYVTPAHQFPLGVTMSLARRLALLAWARRAGAMVLEDDYDSEYRFTGAPLPALQGLDRQERVLYTGSFSKVLFPSLRLGYLVVPPALVDPVCAAKSLASRSAPRLEQAILTDFLVEGHFGRHVRRMRGIYAERLAVLLASARDHLSAHLEFSTVEAGLQTTAWLRKGDGETVARAAAARGIEVMALSRYARAPLARDGLVMGFAAVDPIEIRRGVRELAAVLGGTHRAAPDAAVADQ